MERRVRFNEAFNYLKNKGVIHTQKEVAEKMGATSPNVSSALKGVENVLTDNFLRRFNSAFNFVFNEQWLLTGEGSMLVSDEPQPSVNTGDHSSTAVGAGSTAIHGADAEKYLEIIREQQKSITKLIDTITSNLSQISDSVSGLSDSVSDISDSVSDLSNSVEKLSDPSKTQ